MNDKLTGDLLYDNTDVKRNTLAAEEVDADAQYDLACAYRNGIGVSQDDKTAVHWYKLAAEQGHVDAQFILGVMYDNEEGILPHDKTAVHWYSVAAEQGMNQPSTTLDGGTRTV